ncbi:hypothetical protein H6G95_35000 [Nostoc linckia FACHB-391]|uniref:Uncharacterized protein n=2 Tax=Nostoc TaxID=1177 RepID=A0ABR8IMX0_9NOSO|nr:hypothetical protein [Nostoc linckia]MBD2565682.1 hypothetical protein [Nostoc linckia FACHB-391]MBD2651885.1 hypothetical protein [Nostoc foliaceum FACHB-393]
MLNTGDRLKKLGALIATLTSLKKFLLAISSVKIQDGEFKITRTAIAPQPHDQGKRI